ncbi:SUMF1/EgtB/PvdO family nonheme iron enzyme [Cytophagaceae bacterium ABcell3]|nr:SUMF1/EgtB/PvdO family nonheme iron enzyme [Cytophagaceae bacterium ABcell3]
MSKLLKVLILFIILGLTVNLSEYPFSGKIGYRGQKSGIHYNSEEGLTIKVFQKTVDERKTFKRKASKQDELTDWSMDTVSPSSIADDRALAYKYYSDIPGMVWVEKTLFCDETEVTNLDWLEYMTLTKQKPRYIHQNSHLDEVKYFKSQQFFYFPVVGISHEDAVGYCKWRSEVVTKSFNKKKGYTPTDREYTEFNFKLPTKEEWIKCAAFGTDTSKYPHVFTKKKITTKINTRNLEFLNLLGSTIDQDSAKVFNKKIKKDYLINCFRPDNEYLNLNTPFYVFDYPKNNLGIFNMLGNVSEMVEEKGVAMGGSFRDTFEECTVNSTFNYTTPQDNIGFRCVLELNWPNK